MYNLFMKLNQIISFDIDGVIVDSASNAIKLYNKRFNQNKKVINLKKFFILFDWLTDILKDKNIAAEEAIKIWNDEEVLSQSKPIPGARKLLKILTSKGYQVRFVTSRPGSVRLITLNWFKKWLPWIPEESIHISSSTAGLQRSFKSKTIGLIKPLIHFEDSIEHISDIILASPKTRIILVRQPWNYNITEVFPKTVFVPVGPGVMKNVMSSYNHYLSKHSND